MIYSSLNYCFLLLFSVNPSTQNPPLLIICYLLILVIIRKIFSVNSLWFDPIATIYKFIVDCLIGLFFTASTTAITCPKIEREDSPIFGLGAFYRWLVRLPSAADKRLSKPSKINLLNDQQINLQIVAIGSNHRELTLKTFLIMTKVNK